MYSEILENYAMGFIDARETAEKLIEAKFPDILCAALNNSIYENMQRLKVEEDSFYPALNEVTEIIKGCGCDKEIITREYMQEGILIKEFSVTLYSSWTDRREKFSFDNFSICDNRDELIRIKKYIEEN